MTVLPLDPGANRTPAALRAFLDGCQAAAVRAGRAQLVSISLGVDPLDPLAVLESIFEPGERHFYAERPDEGLAVAGAEAVLSFSASGPGRFAACQRFIDETLDNTLAVGDLAAPFAGPHFFAAFTFADSAAPGEPFEAAGIFVPRWQVGRVGDRTVAVANFLVDAESPLEPLAARVWRAHATFGAFDYSAPDFGATRPAGSAVVSEPGEGRDYREAVRRTLGDIAAGRVEKVVLARVKDLAAPGAFHPLRVLNGLRQRFTDCHAFSLANGRGQSFIGASPERLLRVRGGGILTEAQAGSIRRGASASEDAALAGALLRDEKELREHRLVSGSIAASLASLGIDPELPARPAVRRLANVQHLLTPIQGRLPPGVRLLDVLARLHPTPAVGGTPREAALAAIAERESFPRGLYAGGTGWIDSRGDGEFFVALRSALIDGGRARLYAGAGIVAGSDPDREFAETEIKFRAMQEALLA
jgi:menaquinone-specific isochorismate synthase